MKISSYISPFFRGAFCGLVLIVIVGRAGAQISHAASQESALAPSDQDWPPVLDSKFATTRSIDGRVIERYTHGERKAWGYPASERDRWGYSPGGESGPQQQNHNSFYVVAPKVVRDGAPLCVVLHSANRTAYDYLGYSSLNRKVDPSDEPGAAITGSPDDFYALYLNSTNDEWWGWAQARHSASFAAGVNAPAPAELRVLDTIEWLVSKNHIDRNRIYLCGVSMGGGGSLGIGMAHGDVFAAVRVAVPAGTEYAAYRRGIPPLLVAPASEPERADWLKRASGFGLAEPPVVVDFSAPNDAWSATEPAVLVGAQIGQLPLVLSWGPFGHTGSVNKIGKYPLCQVALDFPWLTIRKDEAYPVFMHASCDQQSPWTKGPTRVDESGQINARFRWKSERDTPTDFAMRLWIEHPSITNASLAVPESATADITPRRLQQFKIKPGAAYAWQLTRDEHVVASGTVMPDAANLLTIPHAPLGATPVVLSLKLASP